MDALSLLITDHNRVKGLFRQFEEADEADDLDTMQAVAAQIREELEVHTTIEEEIFYPAVREIDDEIADTVAEGVEEHHQVKVLLEELATLTADDPAWKAKWTVVIEDVEHHAGEEEDELFPAVRSKRDADQLEELGGRLDARKGELGAPTLADRDGLSAADVRRLATDQDIPGRSTMSTGELRATVQPGGAGRPSGPDHALAPRGADGQEGRRRSPGRPPSRKAGSCLPSRSPS
jgi:hemerythrin superfamily protein